MGIVFLIPNSAKSVPKLINFQGSVQKDGKPIEGQGEFKFAIVDNNNNSLWRNDGIKADGEPSNSVVLPIVRGVFSIALGDTTISNMAALQLDLFDNENLFVRIWYESSDGVYEQLTPDVRLTSVGFAIKARTVEVIPDGIVTNNKLDKTLRDEISSNTSKIAKFEQESNSIGSLKGVFASYNREEVGYKRIHSFSEKNWIPLDATNIPTAGSGQAFDGNVNYLFVWGGVVGTENYIKTGAVFNISTSSWSNINTLNAPDSRTSHSGILGNSEFIIWGGLGSNGLVNTGARYQLSDGSWYSMTTNNAPSARFSSTAIWTGSRMLIWGGRNYNGVLNDGGFYDPLTDTWTPLTSSNVLTPRYRNTAILANNKVIMWGGMGPNGTKGDGAIIFINNGVPVTSGMVPMTMIGAPLARSNHSAIWTGDKMIIWGGVNSQRQLYSDGYTFDPVADIWEPISSVNSPSPRELHAAVWTGNEMLIIAGRGSAGALSDAHAYDPTSNSWRQLEGSVGERYGSTAIWTGEKAIVFGGNNSQQPLIAPVITDPNPSIHLFIKK